MMYSLTELKELEKETKAEISKRLNSNTTLHKRYTIEDLVSLTDGLATPAHIQGVLTASCRYDREAHDDVYTYGDVTFIRKYIPQVTGYSVITEFDNSGNEICTKKVPKRTLKAAYERIVRWDNE